MKICTLGRAIGGIASSLMNATAAEFVESTSTDARFDAMEAELALLRSMVESQQFLALLRRCVDVAEGETLRPSAQEEAERFRSK